MVDFVQSLGLFGYGILAFLVLLIWRLKSIIKLRSPMDSQQHITWRTTGGITDPDHLNSNDVDAFGQAKQRENNDVKN